MIPLIITYKHLYVQKHSDDVRLHFVRKLSLHETEHFIFAKLTRHQSSPKSSDTFEQSINDHSMSETSICSLPNTTTSFIN